MGKIGCLPNRLLLAIRSEAHRYISGLLLPPPLPLPLLYIPKILSLVFHNFFHHLPYFPFKISTIFIFLNISKAKPKRSKAKQISRFNFFHQARLLFLICFFYIYLLHVLNTWINFRYSLLCWSSFFLFDFFFSYSLRSDYTLFLGLFFIYFYIIWISVELMMISSWFSLARLSLCFYSSMIMIRYSLRLDHVWPMRKGKKIATLHHDCWYFMIIITKMIIYITDS